jgi:hypothetical protein
MIGGDLALSSLISQRSYLVQIMIIILSSEVSFTNICIGTPNPLREDFSNHLALVQQLIGSLSPV